MRLNKKQKAEKAWERVYQNVFKHKDLDKYKRTVEVTIKIHGQCPAFMWFRLRSEIFHKIVVPQWLASTDINHRNQMLAIVKRTLGKGLADELQRISNTRTWK